MHKVQSIAILKPGFGCALNDVLNLGKLFIVSFLFMAVIYSLITRNIYTSDYQ